MSRNEISCMKHGIEHIIRVAVASHATYPGTKPLTSRHLNTLSSAALLMYASHADWYDGPGRLPGRGAGYKRGVGGAGLCVVGTRFKSIGRTLEVFVRVFTEGLDKRLDRLRWGNSIVSQNPWCRQWTYCTYATVGDLHALRKIFVRTEHEARRPRALDSSPQPQRPSFS